MAEKVICDHCSFVNERAFIENENNKGKCPWCGRRDFTTYEECPV